MKGYVVGEIEVIDPNIYEEYRRGVVATVEKYGGRFLARGGRAEALEGGGPRRIVILEFPSYDDAMRWYRSTDYAPLAALRQSASHGRLVVVEGA